MRQLLWAQVPKSFLICLYLGQAVCVEGVDSVADRSALHSNGLNFLVEGILEADAEE